MPNKEAPRLYQEHLGPSRLRPIVLKSLVEQGRIPQLDEVVEGSERVVYCYVPSADTKIGDSTFVFAGSRHFQSPTGELRGRPDFFVLTPSQATRLEKRITVFEAKATPQK